MDHEKPKSNNAFQIIISLLSSIGILYVALNRDIGGGISNISFVIIIMLGLILLVGFISYLLNSDQKFLQVIVRTFFIVLLSSIIIYFVSLSGIPTLEIYRQNVDNLFEIKSNDESKYLGKWKIYGTGKATVRNGNKVNAVKYTGQIGEMQKGEFGIIWFDPSRVDAPRHEFLRVCKNEYRLSSHGQNLIFTSDTTAVLKLYNDRGKLDLLKLK